VYQAVFDEPGAAENELTWSCVPNAYYIAYM
jgi:hypothetical protein